MRPLAVLFTVLLVAEVAYYVYIPLPENIQEPWKLLLLDAGFRTTMHLVRGDATIILSFLSVHGYCC